MIVCVCVRVCACVQVYLITCKLMSSWSTCLPEGWRDFWLKKRAVALARLSRSGRLLWKSCGKRGSSCQHITITLVLGAQTILINQPT